MRVDASGLFLCTNAKISHAQKATCGILDPWGHFLALLLKKQAKIGRLFVHAYALLGYVRCVAQGVSCVPI
jgi:hypothetical protein